MLKTTLAFTMASGSGASNVLPSEAWVIGNMRYSHHQGREGSIEAVRRLARRYGVETVVLQGGFPSPVSDSKSEGFVLGLGAGIFTVAGPVLLYGTAAGTLYGVIYWITTLF